MSPSRLLLPSLGQRFPEPLLHDLTRGDTPLRRQRLQRLHGLDERAPPAPDSFNPGQPPWVRRLADLFLACTKPLLNLAKPHREMLGPRPHSRHILHVKLVI